MEDADDSPILATSQSSLLSSEDTHFESGTSNPQRLPTDNKFSDNFKGSLIHAQEVVKKQLSDIVHHSLDASPRTLRKMQHDLLRRSRSRSIDSDDDILDRGLDQVTHGGHNSLVSETSSPGVISFEDEDPAPSALPPRPKDVDAGDVESAPLTPQKSSLFSRALNFISSTLSNTPPLREASPPLSASPVVEKKGLDDFFAPPSDWLEVSRALSESTDAHKPLGLLQKPSTASNIPLALESSLGHLRQIIGSSDKPQAALDAFISFIHIIESSNERQLLAAKRGGAALVCAVLYSYMNDTMVVEGGLQATYWLACNSYALGKLLSNDICETIIKIMHQHSDIELVAEWCCKALCAIAYESKGAVRLVASGAWDALHHTVLVQRHSALVMEWVCRGIYCLSVHQPPETIAPAVSQLISEATLCAHREERAVVIWGLRAIGGMNILSMDARTTTTDGVNHVVEVLRWWLDKDDKDIIVAVCWAIMNMSNDCSVNQVAFLEAEACLLLTGILSKHRRDYEIIRSICLAVHHIILHPSGGNYVLKTDLTSIVISINNKMPCNVVLKYIWYVVVALSSSSELRELLRKSGIVEAVVALLKAADAKSDVECYTHAIAAAANLATDEQYIAILGEVGISRGLVVCGNRFASHAAIVTNCCRAVASLSRLRDNRTWLGAAGICDVLVRIISCNKNDATVAEAALKAFASISVEHDGNLVKLGVAGACRSITVSLHKHFAASKELAEWGLQAIFYASLNTENSTLFVTAGVWEALTAVTNFYTNDAQLVEWACKSTINIAGIDINRSRMRSVGIASAMEQAMFHHVANQNIVEWVCRATAQISEDASVRNQVGLTEIATIMRTVSPLYIDVEVTTECIVTVVSKLARGSMETRQRVGGIGGACDGLVLVLQRHAGHDRIVTLSFDAISDLCECDENRTLFGSVGCCETVVGIVKGHSAPEVVRSGARAIGGLAIQGFNLDKLGVCGSCEYLASCLEKYAENGAVITAVCEAISNLCYVRETTFAPTNRDIFGNCGACENIVAVFHHHDNENTVYHIVSAIAGLAHRHTSNSTKLGALGAIKQLVLSYERFRSSERLAAAMCRALASLSTQYEWLEQEGAVNVVIEAMLAFPKTDEILEFGCRAIAGMSTDDKIRDALVEAGACDAVMRAVARGTGSGDALAAVVLQRVIGTASLGEAACMAIYRLASNPQHRVVLGSIGACEGLSKILQKYADNEAVAAAGNKAVATLSQANSVNQTKLGASNVWKGILAGLQNHPTSERVAKWGCRALEHLVDGNESNTVKVGSGGGCEGVAVAMQSHHGSGEVAGAGCGAIASLALHDSNTARLGATGACEAVITAVQRHAEHKAIAVKGFRAIANLACNSGNSGWLGPAGACSALMMALRHHLNDEVAASEAWRAVGNLCIEEGNINRLGDAGACEAAVAALRLHIIREDAARECCRAISRLATDDKNVKKLIASGVCEAIVVALTQHESTPDVVQEACQAVATLSLHREEVQLKFHAEGACMTIVDVTRKHAVASSMVATAGCAAIRALAKDCNPNQERLGGAGAPDLVFNILLSHERIDSVCGDALSALSALIENNTENASRMSYPRACLLIASVYRKHEKCASVANFGSCVVEVLCREEDIIQSANVRDLLNVGICESLAAALHRHGSSSEAITLSVCGACCRIALHPDGSHRLGIAGICKTLSKLLLIHDRSLPAIKSIINLISVLSEASEGNRNRLGSAGACKNLISAVQLHMHQHTELCEIACRAMIGLSMGCEGNRVKLINAGAVDMIVTVMQQLGDAHEPHRDVTEALQVLGALETTQSAAVSYVV